MAEDNEDDDDGGFYYCIGDSHDNNNNDNDSNNGNDGNDGGILKGGYMCECACPPVMRGDTVKHALTSTSSPPNDVPSIPWSPVVLPLWTPWGAC